MGKITNKPYNCQLELVRGCNRTCNFCAIEVVPKKAYFMTEATLIRTLEGLMPFDPIRIEFAMRGEPTLHPNLKRFVYIIRTFMPKSQITLTSNGIELTRDLMLGFFQSGGNIAIVDCYGKTYDRYMKRFKEFPIVDFYNEDFNPWHRHPANTKKVCIMKDIEVGTDKRQREINNQAGNVNWEKVAQYGLKPLEKPLEKKCGHPFREVAVFADGGVSICCRDWSEENILYNVNDKLISEEWFNNIELERVRTELYNKRRHSTPICARCNFHGGFRLGFLPKEYSDE